MRLAFCSKAVHGLSSSQRSWSKLVGCARLSTTKSPAYDCWLSAEVKEEAVAITHHSTATSDTQAEAQACKLRKSVAARCAFIASTSVRVLLTISLQSNNLPREPSLQLQQRCVMYAALTRAEDDEALKMSTAAALQAIYANTNKRRRIQLRQPREVDTKIGELQQVALSQYRKHETPTASALRQAHKQPRTHVLLQDSSRYEINKFIEKGCLPLLSHQTVWSGLVMTQIQQMFCKLVKPVLDTSSLPSQHCVTKPTINSCMGITPFMYFNASSQHVSDMLMHHVLSCNSV